MKTKQRKSLMYAAVGLMCVSLVCGIWYFALLKTDRSGWIEKNGTSYYRDADGRKVTGWQEIDGYTYYFGENKAMVTGWLELDGKRSFFDADGKLHQSWLELEDGTYYFDEKGTMVTGWLETALGRYYFEADGKLRTGWTEIDGNTYYLTDTGAAQAGVLEYEGDHYCFNEAGILQTGWFTWENDHYYCAEDGKAVTGTVSLDGRQYKFQEDGKRYTGWEDMDGGRCYYGEDGSLVIGWAEIEGKRYYFGDDHKMVTGWHQEGEYRYYLQEDGSAAVGPVEIEGETYYFTPKGIHVVLVNRWIPVPGYYKTGMEVYPPWHEIAEVAYGPMMQMLTDLEAAGYTFEFNNGYRTIQNQIDVLEYYVEQYIDRGYSREAATAECLTFVAPPGHSEHHLGLAIDILNVDEEPPCLEWLHQHCWEYGFILRYTAEKEELTGYVDEPWHFRYVGTEVSLDMKDSGLCLEEYLGAA